MSLWEILLFASVGPLLPLPLPARRGSGTPVIIPEGVWRFDSDILKFDSDQITFDGFQP